LFEIVAALNPGRSLADLLDRGQKKPNKRTDDREDDQQFHKRKGRMATGHARKPRELLLWVHRSGWLDSPDFDEQMGMRIFLQKLHIGRDLAQELFLSKGPVT